MTMVGLEAARIDQITDAAIEFARGLNEPMKEELRAHVRTAVALAADEVYRRLADEILALRASVAKLEEQLTVVLQLDEALQHRCRA